MAKSTGSAGSFSALLSEISTAAQAQGWTEEERYTEGDNSYDLLVLSNPEGFYYYIAQDGTKILVELSASYTATIGWNSIPSKTGTNTVVTNLSFPLVEHNIFASSTEVHVVMEYEAGKFRHLSFGKIDKLDDGSWTGGEYCVATDISLGSLLTTNSLHSIMWEGRQTSSAATTTGKIRTVGIGGSTSGYSTFKITGGTHGLARGSSMLMQSATNGVFGGIQYHAQPNTFNLRARYFPVIIYLSNDATASPTRWIPLGVVNNVRVINNKLMNDSEEDSYNAGWWQYPLTKKDTAYTASTSSSYFAGMAYKA